jgi:hypothetical protein
VIPQGPDWVPRKQVPRGGEGRDRDKGQVRDLLQAAACLTGGGRLPGTLWREPSQGPGQWAPASGSIDLGSREWGQKFQACPHGISCGPPKVALKLHSALQ